MWIDPAFLLNRLDNDYEATAELLNLFLSEFKRLLNDVQQALQAHEPVNRLGHNLKGMCADVGATELALLSASMENKTGNPNQVYAQMAKAIPRIEQEINQFLAKSTP
jgi:HPt (histidine-containing phosphotransfer) domain-containing protein